MWKKGFRKLKNLWPFKRKENFYDKLVKSLKTVKDNKLLFSAQIATTLIYLILAIIVMYRFSIAAVESLQEVFSYIEALSVLDPAASGLLGSDPLMIAQHAALVKIALIKLGVYSLLLAYVFGVGNWLLTKLMIQKKNIKEFLKSFSAVFFSYMIPFGLLFYYTFKIAFKNAIEGTFNPYLNLLTTMILIAILYFYYISVSLTVSSKLKEIPKKTLYYAKAGLLTIPVYATSIILFIGTMLLAYYFTEKNVLLMLLFILLYLASMSFSRVLFAESFD